MKQKITANFFKEENIKLKTRVHILEGELTKKEKLVDDLIMQQDSYQVGAPGNQSTKAGASKMKLESHLSMNLKKKIRDMQTNL